MRVLHRWGFRIQRVFKRITLRDELNPDSHWIEDEMSNRISEEEGNDIEPTLQALLNRCGFERFVKKHLL